MEYYSAIKKNENVILSEVSQTKRQLSYHLYVALKKWKDTSEFTDKRETDPQTPKDMVSKRETVRETNYEFGINTHTLLHIN